MDFKEAIIKMKQGEKICSPRVPMHYLYLDRDDKLISVGYKKKIEFSQGETHMTIASLLSDDYEIASPEKIKYIDSKRSQLYDNEQEFMSKLDAGE